MDVLTLGDAEFPIVRATLSRLDGEPSEFRWCIEIHCDEAIRGVDADDPRSEWLLGVEPYLYAQMLPLRAETPGELVGRRFHFPQSPEDDPLDWEPAGQWPYFCLYLAEHEPAYPMSVAFKGADSDRYRVEIEGKAPCGGETLDLRVATWLAWEA